jgi:hypothetical protein
MKVVILVLLSFNLWALEVKEWKEISNDNGIKVYAANIPGKQIVALKGEIEINAPLDVIATFFYDSSKKHLWIAKLIQIKNLRKPSQYSMVEYYQIETPFFLRNRDFVYKGSISLSDDKTRVNVKLGSVIDSKAPARKKIVRAELVYGEYIAEKITENKTKLTVVMMADPKGSIPKWVVNLYQKSWPRKTLDKIREIAEDKLMPVHPDIKKLFLAK